jgi:hypothetical protein
MQATSVQLVKDRVARVTPRTSPNRRSLRLGIYRCHLVYYMNKRDHKVANHLLADAKGDVCNQDSRGSKLEAQAPNLNRVRALLQASRIKLGCGNVL